MTAPNTAYLDEQGSPRIRRSVVAFIDMLGFSNMSIASHDADASQHLLEKIAAAVEDSRRYVRETMAEETARSTARTWSLKYFSDNLVLGVPSDDDEAHASQTIAFVLRCAQRYQLRMSFNGFFIRGAITDGLLCLSDDIIFGPTLVESYQLESKTAVVPRILITDPLQERLHGSLTSSGAGTATDVPDLICRDIDGWWFVNYLAAARTANGLNWEVIARHKASILASMSGTKRHEILPKYGWACRYHNVFCHWHRQEPGYSDEFRIDRFDERSTITRMIEPA